MLCMDHRTLLKKYIALVSRHEGTDFIEYHLLASAGELTDAEIAELYAVAGQTAEQFEQDRAEYRSISR